MRPLSYLLLLLALPSPALGDAAPRKFAVGVYHFNAQYCAGGLEGFAESLGAQDVWAGLDVSDEGVQDAIIEESFLPLLDLYAAHPDWGTDIELQGLMVDAIAARHPEVLARMQALDEQVSFDSFHWSDELWTAQPAPAIRRSWARARRSYEEASVRPGNAYFTQEGQFGHGMADVVPAGSVLLLPRNLWGIHGLGEPAPLYELGDREVIVAGHGWSRVIGDTPVEVRWVYMDDGELMATGEMNCYLLPVFRHDPDAVAGHEAEIQALVDQGFEVVTTSRLAANLRALGHTPEPLPPIVDGAWQPDDTANLGLWMGDGGAFSETERDNGVRTSWHRAYRDLRAAEVLGVDAARLDEAWDHLLLAGVSDATGWNPFETETRYSLDHALMARRLVLPALQDAARACEGWLSVEPGTGTAECRPTPREEGLVAEPALLDPSVHLETEGGGVAGELIWRRDPERPGALLLRARWTGADVALDPWRELRLPWTAGAVRFLPAGQEEEWLEVPLPPFATLPEPLGLPLGNGVLSDGTRFLVLDPTKMSLAARFDLGAGELVFRDETAALDAVEVWELWITEDEVEARDLALHLVTEPRREMAGTFTRPPVRSGCSTLGPRSAPDAAFSILALSLSARRRARAPTSNPTLPPGTSVRSDRA